MIAVVDNHGTAWAKDGGLSAHWENATARLYVNGPSGLSTVNANNGSVIHCAAPCAPPCPPCGIGGGGGGGGGNEICTVVLEGPESATVPGQISAFSHVVCNVPMSQIEIMVDIYAAGGAQVATRLRTANGVSGLFAVAGFPCVAGQYYAEASVDLVWPPNSDPPTSEDTLETAPVTITC